MLPRKNRLLETKDFEMINRTGSFFYFGEVFLKVRRNNSEETRVGFSIGIKFSPKAVERNRVKRQLREIFRKNIEKFKKGNDMMVSLKKGGKKEFLIDDLERDVLAVLKKAKLI
ncbi:MAG: ribonuclease P protein component [Parcubacteria group bacterium]|jgi:ribonuclease P protein component